MSDTDLDAIEARLASLAPYHREHAGYGGASAEFHARAQTTIGDALSLIAAVRSERARAVKAEGERDRMGDRWEHWQKRALAAEPFMKAFEWIEYDEVWRVRIVPGTNCEADIAAADHLIAAINRLAATLRAQDEPKREPSVTNHGNCPYCGSSISYVQRDGMAYARCSRRDCGARGPCHAELSRAVELFRSGVVEDEPKREPAPFGHVSRANECQVELDVCGKQCDHGSECLMLPGHDGGHETQHGCVFYDAEPKREPSGSEPCADCHGSGWVWGHEQNIGDHVTDTKYTCRKCDGSGREPTTTEEP